MLRLLLVFFYLAQLVRGSSINGMDSSCPPPDGTTRSVWSILGSCAVTLLICVWHTIHFDIQHAIRPSIHWNKKWSMTWWSKGLCVVVSFIAPEVIVAWAAGDWKNARKQTVAFQEAGYSWSMTHSFFAEMSGFEYCDDKGHLHTIDSSEFLRRCKANEIANPLITAGDIKDRSKSDGPGKTVLFLQLFWFVLHVVRGSIGLAVTLVELDTVCMTVLSLLVLSLWWHKPLHANHPHVFYSPQVIKLDSPTVSNFSDAWKPNPSCLSTLMGPFGRTSKSTAGDEESAGTNGKPSRSTLSRFVDAMEDDFVTLFSLCATWMILGGLHLIAWNFDFPTGTEKISWRVASLVLTGGPLAALGLYRIAMAGLNPDDLGPPWFENCVLKVFGALAYLVPILTVVSRLLLVALMLASLRALPCSAYQTVS